MVIYLHHHHLKKSIFIKRFLDAIFCTHKIAVMGGYLRQKFRHQLEHVHPIFEYLSWGPSSSAASRFLLTCSHGCSTWCHQRLGPNTHVELQDSVPDSHPGPGWLLWAVERVNHQEVGLSLSIHLSTVLFPLFILISSLTPFQIDSL